jgi:hypothetical protein
VGPVLEDRLERLLQRRRLERLDVIAVVQPVGLVEQADEHLHGPVVVDGAEDGVEVDGAVEETPGDVAHQRRQEGVDRHDVAAARVPDVREVLVARERELPDGELAIAQR